jgi:hypothetical protein
VIQGHESVVLSTEHDLMEAEIATRATEEGQRYFALQDKLMREKRRAKEADEALRGLSIALIEGGESHPAIVVKNYDTLTYSDADAVLEAVKREWFDCLKLDRYTFERRVKTLTRAWGKIGDALSGWQGVELDTVTEALTFGSWLSRGNEQRITVASDLSQWVPEEGEVANGIEQDQLDIPF